MGFHDVAFLPSELVFRHTKKIVVEVMTLGPPHVL